jgi:hypothetical protein
MTNPKLKLKYVTGLGDLIACFLHSKCIGWFTKILTGKSEPCEICSQRSKALNLLVPMKIWKLFFKNEKEFLNSLSNEYTIYSQNKKENIAKKETQQPQVPSVNINLKGYTFISSSDTNIGEYLIRLQTFKIN